MQLSLTRASDVIKAPFQRGPPAGEQMPELGLLGWLLTEGGTALLCFIFLGTAFGAQVSTAGRAAGCGRLAPRETAS